jgi:cellobiose-specific phosphotransferase system component IIC
MLSLYNHIIVQIFVVICIGLSFKSLPASIANVMRKIVGFGCILLAIAATYFFIKIGMKEMSASNVVAAKLMTNRIQWIILIAIFLPIMYGLGIYGYRAFRGVFDNMEKY